MQKEKEKRIAKRKREKGEKTQQLHRKEWDHQGWGDNKGVEDPV